MCSCEAEGELSPSTAPVYYQYGLALLSQVQNSSDAFGGAVKKSDGTPGVAPPAGANSSREESLEIAWEVLDVARVIYSRGVRAWPRAAVVYLPSSRRTHAHRTTSCGWRTCIPRLVRRVSRTVGVLWFPGGHGRFRSRSADMLGQTTSWGRSRISMSACSCGKPYCRLAIGAKCGAGGRHCSGLRSNGQGCWALWHTGSSLMRATCWALPSSSPRTPRQTPQRKPHLSEKPRHNSQRRHLLCAPT